MVQVVENQAELRELYRELILDHARNPRNFRKLDDVTHRAEGINPLCGDKLRLYLLLDATDTVIDAAFEGSGCAISVASASLLTERIPGMSKAEALDLFRAIVSALTDSMDDTGVDFGKLDALRGVREFPSRVKCATLAWHAMASALNHDAGPATTE